jgi:hypothetical protein
VRRPIGLKLSGDLGLVSQISGYVLVSRFNYFLSCKQTKEQQKRRNCKNRGFQNLRFLRRAESVWSETWWEHPDKY